jgi:hypothetical protein
MGIFKNHISNQYYTNLLPYIMENNEKLVKSDGVIINQLNKTLQTNMINKNKQLHKEALLKERARKADMEKKKIEDLEVNLY